MTACCAQSLGIWMAWAMKTSANNRTALDGGFTFSSETVRSRLATSECER
jgi:hypothetical protein